MALSLVTAQRALELLASPKKPVAIVNSRYLSLGYGCPSAIISVESLPALSCKAASAFDDFVFTSCVLIKLSINILNSFLL